MAKTNKQAVILIHGIGEQRPMDSLRGFVRAVWKTDASVHHHYAQGASNFYSKPDTVSKSFELRRLTTGQNRANIRTDFFEFYWAHLMRGTRPSDVLGWAQALLFRWPWNVSKELRGVWALVVTTMGVVFGAWIGYGLLAEDQQLIALPPAVSWILGVLLSSVAGLIVIRIVGDAARYLHCAPPNIQRRQEIRSKGVELLRSLNDCGEYSRIIVVGHSLGSVIGYDVLTHAWPFYSDKLRNAPTTHEQLDALERIADDESFDLGAYQRAQRAYAAELNEDGCAWLVTDFVTLGSPLTHATTLLADGDEHLAAKQKDREFPTCPPEPEGDRPGFSYERGAVRVPHHAAVFAPTRWTNLYFPASYVFRGDVVGGPLRHVFGPGVRDVEVRTPIRKGFLSHTTYWSPGPSGTATHAIDELRKALDLAHPPAWEDKLCDRCSPEEALVPYEAAARKKPKSAVAHRDLGFLYAHLGRQQAAQQHLEQAAQLDRRTVEECDKAIESGTAKEHTATERDAALAMHLKRGRALQRLGRYDDAAAAFVDYARQKQAEKDASGTAGGAKKERTAKKQKKKAAKKRVPRTTRQAPRRKKKAVRKKAARKAGRKAAK